MIGKVKIPEKDVNIIWREDVTFEERGMIIDLGSRHVYSCYQQIVLIATNLEKEQINEMDADEVMILGKALSENLTLGKKKRSFSG